jgi:hypothetical protein
VCLKYPAVAKTDSLVTLKHSKSCEPYRACVNRPRAAIFGHTLLAVQPKGRWPSEGFEEIVMTGTTPCRTCGQVNGSDSEFCVRCGEKLPDPASTQIVNAPGGVDAPAEYPWEPPAEWDPGELPPTAPPGGQQQTWVGRGPDQVGWNTGNDTGGGGSGGAGASPWGSQPSQPGYAATPAPTAPGPYQGGYPGGPPQQPSNVQGAGGSRKPLLIGGGAIVVIAIIVAVILLASGGGKDKSALNGVQTQTGTQALTSARVALRNAQSVHLTGTVKSDGQNITVDLELVGANSQGTLTVDNNDVQLIKLGETVYIKGDPDFLTKYANGNAAAVKALNGKWLKTASTSDFDAFSIDGFADQLKAGSDVKVNSKTTQATEGGQPVVVLTQTDGSTLSIANTGTPYPLSLHGKTASEGQLTFSDYNKPITVTAPTDVFDVSGAATPTAAPTPSASPTADSVHGDLIGDYKCTIDGTTNGGGSITLDANTTYSVPNGVGGTWQSSGNAVAFIGGYLNGYAGTFDGDDTVHLRGSGTNASVALTCVFT